MSQKLVKELAEKKYRTQYGLFLVEGAKSITEVLASHLTIEEIYGTDDFLDTVEPELHAYAKAHPDVHFIVTPTKESTLSQMGTLQSNNAGIAVVRMEAPRSLSDIEASAMSQIVLMLSDVRDPGNLGTIMRTADWFGITDILVSPTTVDAYNAKVIAASMGSHIRTRVTACELGEVLLRAKAQSIPILGGDASGISLYATTLPSHGYLVMGSESHGIDADLIPYLSQLIAIPRLGQAESLNVSTATGMLLSEMLRAKLSQASPALPPQG
jgi:RNA methyltransferase, TrmH family